MSDVNKVSNIQEDAEIKFSKLCEIVEDINVNGQEGDQFARQAVFSGIVHSDNLLLWQKIAETLFDFSQSELMRTVVIGLLMQKKDYENICKYAEIAISSMTVIDEKYESNESLLLLTDSLVDATSSEDVKIQEIAMKFALKLYKLSCSPESTAIIADHVLQRFINILPNKNDLINNALLNLIKDVEEEINSRVIAVDILSRSIPVEFLSIANSMVLDIKKHSKNHIEQMYLLDVLTKYLFNAISSKISDDDISIILKLNNIDLENILKNAKAEQGKDNQHFEVIYKRIKRRIFQLNDKSNSRN